MDSGFYKSPWFLILVGITLWACGYITADDNRIERENHAISGIRAQIGPYPACSHDPWQEAAKSRHTP